MSINKVEETVGSYLNGNISDFKRWLKKTSKSNVVAAVEILNGLNTYGRTGSEIVYRLLNE